MKYLLSISLFLVLTSSVFAQDLIVTHEGDSLNCKVTNEKNGYVYFTFKHKGETRSTLLSDTNVISLKREYFEHTEISNIEAVRGDYERYRIAFSGG